MNQNTSESENEVETVSNTKNKERSKFARVLYFTAGTFCLVLGIIGIV